MVRRAELLARLDRAPVAAMVLLVAPGGYGKTTLLSQWAARPADPCAWVTAGPDDNDPDLLALHIALALQSALPSGPHAEWLDQVTSRSRPVQADLLKAVAALRRLGRSVVLVLDDLHELHSRASLALVGTVVEEGGPALRVAAATRTRPDLVLPALVAAGRCVELGPADLAFSEAEARQVFVAARQAVTPDDARALVQRTEGWPAGVYLAALAARRGPGGAPSTVHARIISGDDVYIADYFRDEVLAGEPSDNVRFLLRTAVLDRMSGPLCDAVLQTTGSGARLLEAARRGLFVVPLDRDGGWYRYHRLFQEMLLQELRLREPGEELRLHRGAAAWFEAEGLPDEAITHALAGEDRARAARLIDLRARQAFAAGRRTTVLDWLRRLDDAALAAYPPLAVTAGWIWAFTGHPVWAQNALRLARAADPAGPLPDGSSSLESATALLAAFLAPLGVERMADDARRAVDLEPAGTPQRTVALALLGAAHALGGRPELALPELAEVAELGRVHAKRTAAFAHAELAVLALSGDEGRADDDITASLALLQETGLEGDFEAMLAYAAAAWSAARAGDVPTVRRYVASVQRIGADAFAEAVPWYAAHVSIVLGRAALEAGDPLAARARIEEARQYLGHLLTEGVLRRQVDELAHLLAGTGTPVGLPSPMALTAAEIRVLQLLPTHLSLGEIADDLHVSRNTIKSQVAATYRKLQATTRAEAVRRGHELGLLTGGSGEPDRPTGTR
ncbi:MAG TPA: LuxR C-terminal-related transcriptional regulator [Kineosporiaceae bacterium]|nr:LuxR C-terminal-related transcriptional regulator [Kineosporiaceae bacterium]